MTGSELLGYLGACLVLALVVFGVSRLRHREAWASIEADGAAGARPYRSAEQPTRRAGFPPAAVAASALAGLMVAFAAPGWGLMTMVLAVLGMDPPPADASAAGVVTWFLLCSPFGLVAFVQLLRSSLALLRGDPRAEGRARRAMWLPGVVLLGMVVVVGRTVAAKGVGVPWSLMEGVVLGGPGVALGVAGWMWRVGGRGRG